MEDKILSREHFLTVLVDDVARSPLIEQQFKERCAGIDAIKAHDSALRTALADALKSLQEQEDECDKMEVERDNTTLQRDDAYRQLEIAAAAAAKERESRRDAIKGAHALVDNQRQTIEKLKAENARLIAKGGVKPMTGIELMASERERQVSVEGWTPEHDDSHEQFELSRAARCYAMAAPSRKEIHAYVVANPSPTWPWATEWWKPSDDPIRNLVKAGALIAAEIDRLQRLQTPITQSLPITTGKPQPCPMPGCHGETEMAFYVNRNEFWVRCKTHPLWHFGPHRETEAEALAAWNEPLVKRLEGKQDDK